MFKRRINNLHELESSTRAPGEGEWSFEYVSEQYVIGCLRLKKFTLDLNAPGDTPTIGAFEVVRGGGRVMCGKTFDLEGQKALEGVGEYVVGLVGVDLVRNVDEGVRGGTSEDPEICGHDPRDCDVGEKTDRAR